MLRQNLKNSEIFENLKPCDDKVVTAVLPHSWLLWSVVYPEIIITLVQTIK